MIEDTVYWINERMNEWKIHLSVEFCKLNKDLNVSDSSVLETAFRALVFPKHNLSLIIWTD